MIQAPWERDADLYGEGAANLLWSMPNTLRDTGRGILEDSLARGETPLGALTRLIGFECAIRNFYAIPRKPQPKVYSKTRRRDAWIDRCLDLIESGQPQTEVIKACVQALTEARRRLPCTVPAYEGLEPDIKPAKGRAPAPVSISTIRRGIRRAREARRQI
jgi:hypothetical protein